MKNTLDTVKADPLSSLPMRTAVAKAMVSSNVGTKSEAASLILDSKLSGRCVSVETCQEALKFMESLGKEGSAGKDQLLILILSKFPFAKNL